MLLILWQWTKLHVVREIKGQYILLKTLYIKICPIIMDEVALQLL